MALLRGRFTVYMVYLDKPLWFIALCVFECMWWGGLCYWSICFALECRRDRKNEIEFEKLLNERQRELYNYLLSRGDEWVSQKDIAFALKDWYDVSTFGGAMDFHNSLVELEITADIRAINDNAEVEKVIISGIKGVKIANEEESARFIKNQYGQFFADSQEKGQSK